MTQRPRPGRPAPRPAAGRFARRGSRLFDGVRFSQDLGDRGHLSLDLRGRPDLPTILAAGPPITTPLGHCHFLGGQATDSAAGIRQAVIEHAERGCDVIKIMASGGDDDARHPTGRCSVRPRGPHDIARRAVGQLAEIGLSPVEALQTLTSRAARVLGLVATKGRLAAGHDADILVVDGDLEQSPEVIHNVLDVYARGRPVRGPLAG